MSSYSKFPIIHQYLEYIPYSISWNEVITTYPSISHCQWFIFFAIFTSIIQLIVYIISKITARKLIGYAKHPPLPTGCHISLSSYYLKLGQHVNYDKHIKIEKYSLTHLSKTYCDSKISTLQIKKWFFECNEFHANNRLQRVKFREYLFPILVKSMCFLFGCYTNYDKLWLYDRSLFYVGWPNNQQLDCCIADIKLLFMFNIGFYIYRIFSALFLDRHLKDFIPTIIHHFASFIVLIICYCNGFVRVALVSLLLHDPGDIVLQSAKFFRLIRLEMLCNLFFALLCVVWLSTRVIAFPYHCILSIDDFWRQHPNCANKDKVIMIVMAVLSILLYLLHLHWFRLLIAAAIKVLKGGGLSDSRSDSEKENKKEK